MEQSPTTLNDLPVSGIEVPMADFNVAVIESDPSLRSQLISDLGERVRAAAFPTIESLEERVEDGTPLVALLGPSCAGSAGLIAVERLTRSRPEIGTVLMVEALSTDVLQRALRAGVKDVLAAPIEPGELVLAVERVGGTLTPAGVVTPSEPGAPAGYGRLITVFSTKGGAGKSVIAVNLAVTLARRSTRPVVLVDADLQFGDVAVMLKLAPQHTIVDAVNAIDKLDGPLLQSLLARHDPSELLVMPAPLEPAFADQIGSSQMLRIIELLRQTSEFVVVDAPAYFNDVVLGLIEASDDVLLVAGMDIPNIKNVKIGLQTLRLLNIPLSKLKLILNRANSKVKLDVGEVERTLGIKADCLVPSDVVVPQSVNRGTPVVLDAPKSGVAKSLEQLADLFISADAKRKR
ncbi:MAG: response regulator receiver protein [Actinobacteria bacterium]|nr:MAG: response regulator receiver protein [Actinomycetota bacterium]